MCLCGRWTLNLIIRRLKKRTRGICHWPHHWSFSHEATPLSITNVLSCQPASLAEGLKAELAWSDGQIVFAVVVAFFGWLLTLLLPLLLFMFWRCRCCCCCRRCRWRWRWRWCCCCYYCCCCILWLVVASEKRPFWCNENFVWPVSCFDTLWCSSVAASELLGDRWSML